MFKPIFNYVKNEAQKEATIYLYGVIGNYWDYDSPLTAKGFLRQLNALTDVNTINIRVNTPGGDVLEGLGIVNAIRSSKKTINVYNDGICASMGFIILSSAKDGHRFAAKGSLGMAHSAGTITFGNSKTHRSTADMLDKHDSILAEYVADAMAKDVTDVVKDYFDGENHWLTAKEMETLGMISIADYEADTSQMPENATAMAFESVAAFYMGRTPQPTQINNHDMFGKDKFKSLSALAKHAVADITAEMVEAVNNEIETEKVPGVTLVLDSTLQKVQDEAEKVPGLNTKVTDLEGKLTTEQTKVTDLEKEVKELKAKLNLPAEEAETPAAAGSDATPADTVVDNFETSVDREFKKIYGV
ncbi:ATP-dependent Clp protease proteolytic subunit 2 [compost metagenome]